MKKFGQTMGRTFGIGGISGTVKKIMAMLPIAYDEQTADKIKKALDATIAYEKYQDLPDDVQRQQVRDIIIQQISLNLFLLSSSYSVINFSKYLAVALRDKQFDSLLQPPIATHISDFDLNQMTAITTNCQHLCSNLQKVVNEQQTISQNEEKRLRYFNESDCEIQRAINNLTRERQPLLQRAQNASRWTGQTEKHWTNCTKDFDSKYEYECEGCTKGICNRLGYYEERTIYEPDFEARKRAEKQVEEIDRKVQALQTRLRNKQQQETEEKEQISQTIKQAKSIITFAKQQIKKLNTIGSELPFSAFNVSLKEIVQFTEQHTDSVDLSNIFNELKEVPATTPYQKTILAALAGNVESIRTLADNFINQETSPEVGLIFCAVASCLSTQLPADQDKWIKGLRSFANFDKNTKLDFKVSHFFRDRKDTLGKKELIEISKYLISITFDTAEKNPHWLSVIRTNYPTITDPIILILLSLNKAQGSFEYDENFGQIVLNMENCFKKIMQKAGMTSEEAQKSLEDKKNEMTRILMTDNKQVLSFDARSLAFPPVPTSEPSAAPTTTLLAEQLFSSKTDNISAPPEEKQSKKALGLYA